MAEDIVKAPSNIRHFHAIRAPRGAYQCDIAFIPYALDDPKYRAENKGMSAILLCIEIATRYLYGVPLASKSAPEVYAAFKAIDEQIVRDTGSHMNAVTMDADKCFNSTIFRQYIHANNIQHYEKETHDRYSLAVIDRACGVLKKWLYDAQVLENTLNWVALLPDVIERYNNHHVRTMGATPVELRGSIELQEQANAAAHEREADAIDDFEALVIGDHVRIRQRPEDQPRNTSALTRNTIAKGTTRWSNKVYTIRDTAGFSFVLDDLQGRTADRTYRAHELHKVADDAQDVPDIFAPVASHARQARRNRVLN